MIRSLRRLCLLASLLVLGLATSASVLAHAGLVKAVPAAGSHGASPARIVLTFNEALVPRATRVTVSRVGAGGTLAKVEAVEVALADDGKTVHATPGQALAAGEYEVEWRVVGADQHPISGRHRFTVH